MEFNYKNHILELEKILDNLMNNGGSDPMELTIGELADLISLKFIINKNRKDLKSVIKNRTIIHIYITLYYFITFENNTYQLGIKPLDEVAPNIWGQPHPHTFSLHCRNITTRNYDRMRDNFRAQLIAPFVSPF